MRWIDLITETPILSISNTDGHLYTLGTEKDSTTSGTGWNGYRVEPVINFSQNGDRDLLEEIWLESVETGDYSIDIYHRGGETVSECKNSVWTSLGSISCNDPADPYLPVKKNHRFHQIKWGTDLEDEAFVVTGIEFKYVPQARR